MTNRPRLQPLWSMNGNEDCVCGGRRWLVFARDKHEAYPAVERCDKCSSDLLTDADAAQLAIAAGLQCETKAPHYVIGEVPEKFK